MRTREKYSYRGDINRDNTDTAIPNTIMATEVLTAKGEQTRAIYNVTDIQNDNQESLV